MELPTPLVPMQTLKLFFSAKGYIFETHNDLGTLLKTVILQKSYESTLTRPISPLLRTCRKIRLLRFPTVHLPSQILSFHAGQVAVLWHSTLKHSSKIIWRVSSRRDVNQKRTLIARIL